MTILNILITIWIWLLFVFIKDICSICYLIVTKNFAVDLDWLSNIINASLNIFPSDIIVIFVLIRFLVSRFVVAVKRFHDFDFSWRYVLTLLIPIANIVFEFMLLLKEWTSRENKYWKKDEYHIWKKKILCTIVCFLLVSWFCLWWNILRHYKINELWNKILNNSDGKNIETNIETNYLNRLRNLSWGTDKETLLEITSWTSLDEHIILSWWNIDNTINTEIPKECFNIENKVLCSIERYENNYKECPTMCRDLPWVADEQTLLEVTWWTSLDDHTVN